MRERVRCAAEHERVPGLPRLALKTNLRIALKQALAIALAGLLLIGLLLVAVTTLFVWPPHVTSGKASILGSKKLRDGSSVAVVQWWNNFDFYSTWLVYYSTSDSAWYCNVIDGDDRKHWSIGLVVDETAGVFRVGQGRTVKLYGIYPRTSALPILPLFPGEADLLQPLDAKLPWGLDRLRH